MSKEKEKIHNSGQRSHLPTWLSPLLVLWLRQECNTPYSVVTIMALLVLFSCLLLFALGIRDGCFLMFLSFYLIVGRSFFLLKKSRNNWELSKMEPLLLTSLGSFQIIKGLWLIQMVDVFVFAGFSLLVGGIFWVMGWGEAVQMLAFFCVCVTAGAITAVFVWCSFKNLWWKAVCFASLFFLFHLIGFFNEIFLSSQDSLKDKTLFFWLLPLACLLMVGTYVVLIFAACEVNHSDKVAPLAFRRAMMGSLLVPVVLLLPSRWIPIVDFNLIFYCTLFFLCFCFMSDAVHSWYRVSEEPVERTSGRRRLGRLFFQEGWESGALFFLCLGFILGGFFDVLVNYACMSRFGGMIPGYGIYAVLMAANCLLVFMVVLSLCGRNTRRVLPWFLPLAVVCAGALPQRPVLYGQDVEFLSGLIPFFNTASYNSSLSALWAYALFTVTTGILYWFKTRRYWRSRLRECRSWVQIGKA